MGGEEGEPLGQDGKMATTHGMDAACSKMAGVWPMHEEEEADRRAWSEGNGH
jgi:hypothetical protein